MYLPLFGWAVFILLVWFPVERANLAYCFNNYDLGIYAQALSLISLEDLNPFLSTRGIRLFNDHFDPILFLFAPFREFVRPDLLAIRVEMLAVFLASVAPLWLWRQGVVGRIQALVAFFIILFSPMTLRAVFFPAHPGTWSLAPLAWFFAFLYVDKRRLAFLMFIFVFACKEEYPVMGVGIALMLLYQGRKRLGLWTLVLSLSWGLGVFVLRPVFLGKSDFYTSAMITGRGLSGSDVLRFWLAGVQALVMVFGPWMLLYSWDKLRKDLFDRRSPIWLAITAVVILLLIRLVGGYWENHRMAALTIPAAFMLLGGTKTEVISGWRTKCSMLMCIGIIWPAVEQGGRSWRARPFKAHCPSEIARVNSISGALGHLESMHATDVLAIGNLVPRIALLPGVEQVGASRNKDFNFFLVEKSPYRNTWPLSQEEFSEVERTWRQRSDVVVLRDDQYVLLLEKKAPSKANVE